MDIDERLAALTASLEVMSGMLRDTDARIDKLAVLSERHEKQRQRFDRAFRAALQAWFNENGEEQE